MCCRLYRLAALVCLVGAVSSEVHAADQSDVLSDYSITSWSDKDGLPRGAIRALAQDQDGYLWIGSEYGLIRFDGARFQTWEALGNAPLPSGAVQALLVGPDGSLWVSLANDQNGVISIKGREVQRYQPDEGLPPGEVTSLTMDRSGVIWVAQASGLFRFSDHRWTRETGLPPGRPRRVIAGASGRLFVALAQSVAMREAGGNTFVTLETPERFVNNVFEDRAQNVWMSDNFLGAMPKGGRRVAALARRARGSNALLTGVHTALIGDQAGGLWLGTSGQGLWYARTPSPTGDISIEAVTTLNGLSNDIVNVVLEDNEGNIWAGTADGLNRLRRYPFASITDLGVVTGLDTNPDGTIWASTAAGLVRFPAGNIQHRELIPLSTPPRAMHVDAAGGVWMATDSGVSRYEVSDGRTKETRITDTFRRVRGIGSNGRDDAWIYDIDRGLAHWNGQQLETHTLPAGLQRTLICGLLVDTESRLWLGLPQEQVYTVAKDGSTALYGPAEGIAIGNCQTLYEDLAHSVWILGLHGIARFSNGHFTTLRGPGDIPLESVHGMAQDASGAFWLNSESSIARLVPADIERAFAGQMDKVHPTTYNASAGIAGTQPRVGRSAVRAANSNLWFMTTRGITIVDPTSIRETVPATPVHFDTVVVDDQRPLGIPATLPPGVRRVEVEFSVPMLSPGARPQFRYRLDGFDTEWHDAGPNQRRLAYTNLPPHDYKLRVENIATDGALRSMDVWAFSVLPAFYQTTWFAALVFVALGGLASLAWRMRIGQVRGEFAILLKERVRLSREIHDTLLQSLIGVALQLEQVEHDTDASPAGRQRLTTARKQVEEYIREARESIWNLRSSTLEREGLPAALRHAGERAVAETREREQPVDWRFEVVGKPVRCAPDVEEQLLRIGQEAVTNATRHAHAQHITMELRYDSSSVTLRVSDDGRGFSPSDMPDVNGSHWGLVNMRERADAVGGSLKLSSAQGTGTLVEAIVPSSPDHV